MPVRAKPIYSFTGKYAFLSNFHPCEIRWGKVIYPSVEHAFQASKSTSPNMRLAISEASTPGRAKRLGRQVELRRDWENVKVPVMRSLLIKKFAIPDLAEQLLATGDRELIEGNTWNDIYWGVCEGRGLNMLGKLLMEVRESLNVV